uniref:Uncharacterized protein n=1 Tax=Triticum urartu TaxID=4572 RepID=A0A8R7Q618_TRIUA
MLNCIFSTCTFIGLHDACLMFCLSWGRNGTECLKLTLTVFSLIVHFEISANVYKRSKSV